MHNIFRMQKSQSFQNLPDNSPNLIRLQLIIFFSILYFFMQRDSLQQLQNDIKFIPILKNLIKFHQILLV